MQDVAELMDRFAMPGTLSFEATAEGLLRVRVTTAAAKATVYLQGAHLTDWQPDGRTPVLFLSPKSEFAPGKAIRGGVPVIFPWFGPRHDGKGGPSHGFARTEVWELAFAALAGEAMHLTFTLNPNEVSRGLGFDHFRVAYTMTIGRTLTLELTVANEAGTALVFEEALHSYLAVKDAQRIAIEGLGGTAFLDKTDAMQRKVQPEGTLQLVGTTDRVYLDTETTCVVEDKVGERAIAIEKSGSHSTVVWNPWTQLDDMEPEGWRGMVCVETANVGESQVTLTAGETHTMRAAFHVEGLA